MKKKKSGTINILKSLISPVKLIFGAIVASIGSIITYFFVCLPLIIFTPSGTFSFGSNGSYILLGTIMLLSFYLTLKWLFYTEKGWTY